MIEQENDVKEIFLQLAMSDIEEACDLMRPVWDEGDGKDGYVSMEVDPNFAYDTAATIEEAARFHELGRAAEPLREDSRHPSRDCAAIEEMIARRPEASTSP